MVTVTLISDLLYPKTIPKNITKGKENSKILLMMKDPIFMTQNLSPPPKDKSKSMYTCKKLLKG